MTSRAEYPKRHWIREDIDAADGALKKVSTVKDHWFLTVLEASLSLRKGSEDLYVRRGVDGKPELNFDALRTATKGIFDEGESSYGSWLKAMPWLAAGFVVGTPRWAAAVISIAISRVSQLHEDRMGLKGGMEEALTGLGVSPKMQDDLWVSPKRPKLHDQRRRTTGQRRVRSKLSSADDKLVTRYERCLSTAGVPYFFDHVNKTRSWDAPDQQEMCLKITDPPLSKRWEEMKQEGRTVYFNRITEEATDTRPGRAEIWVVRKKVKSGWVRSTMMTLPHGWKMCRTEEGEIFYLNHNADPPTSTTTHPMRQEIERERRSLLPEWNVEWDYDRGKKYRKIMTGEIRWKAIDGPRFEPTGDKIKITFENSHEGFIEPLPPGWIVTVREDGQKVYKNGKVGKERVERVTHPLTDKRRRLQPEWEMRYTLGNRRYWVHYGSDERGTTWWTRNRLLKNTSLKNNASGWKLAPNGLDWERFEGGDVPHSEIPILDLDDPAGIEFREYPFLLPPRIIDENGTFLEPLPPEWVRRTQEDGAVYYWNSEDEVRSAEHPNKEERRNLPALWEMRFTRHGRQYFVRHDDGSTWWTHPSEAKNEQKMRARPGQKQDGWKIAEDGKTWERFEDRPDAQSTEDSLDTLSRAQSAESEVAPGGRTAWRSPSLSNPREWLKSVNSSDSNPRNWLKSVDSSDSNPRNWLKSIDSSESNPRNWLKSVNSSELSANAKTRIARGQTLLNKFSRSPSISPNTSLTPKRALSPQDLVGDEEENLKVKEWLEGSPDMIEEPEPAMEPEQEKSSQTNHTEENLPSATVSDSLQEDLEKGSQIREKRSGETQLVAEDPSSNEGLSPASTPQLQSNETPNTASPPEPQPHEASEPTDTPAKGAKKGWLKNTKSHLLALKEKHENKRGSKGRSAVPDGKAALEHDLEPVVDGLGITGTAGSDVGIATEVLPPAGRETDGGNVTGSIEHKEDKATGGGEQKS